MTSTFIYAVAISIYHDFNGFFLLFLSLINIFVTFTSLQILVYQKLALWIEQVIYPDSRQMDFHL